MIDILMATYNGAEYISTQLDSLLAQSYTNWQLLIRDDGSSDRTLDICRDYAAKYPTKIRVIEDSLGNLGVAGNYMRLLEQSAREYVMFCDQDDVWLPEKIDVTSKAMKEAEGRLGNYVPIAVYTDLKVVDSTLSPVCDSLFRYTQRNPHVNNHISKLCMASCTYGCTMMINRRLKSLYAGFPDGVSYWDLWLGMIAAAFGSLEYVDKPTILYRRHDQNQSGLSSAGLSNYLRRKKNIIQYHRRPVYVLLSQHKVFYETFKHMLSKRQERLLADIASIPTRNWAMRRYILIRHGLFKTGFVKNVGLFLVI